MEEMRVRVRTTVNGLAMVVLLAAGAAAWGQALPAAPSAAPCADTTKPAGNCSTTPDAPAPASAPPKSTAQQFPFPGSPAQPANAAPDAPSDAPSAPSDRKAPKTPLPAFPGEPGANGDSPSSSSSSSSSSGSSGAADDPANAPDDPGTLGDAGSSGDTIKPGHSRRRRLPKTEVQTPEARAAEDLSVAAFYSNDGNYAAAYLRAKDAVQYQPDAYSHFALAEAAFKLGKRDEAKEHYNEVLKLDPIPKQLKASEKALAELASSEKQK
jgi:hypothetical protein